VPLINDPNANVSLLTPRGYFNLPGADEETKPEKPRAPDPIAPSIGDSIHGFVRNFSDQSLEANFRVNNTVASAIARMQETAGVSNELTDPSYSPWEDVKGTPYEQYWKNTFAYSNNPKYTAALKSSIDRQENDRRTVDAGGAGGTIAGIIAGTIDPTILLPVGGEISLVGKGVWNVGRGALAGARAGAIGTAGYEAALHASQETRTVEESLVNISTGVVLGSVLGGTIAGALSRTQRVGSEAALEKLYNEPVPGFVGAAAAQKMSLDDLTINGKITENIAAGTAFSPNLRGNFRESPLARQTYQEVATNTLLQNMHLEGLSLGPSVETNINVSLGETLGQALEHYPSIFRESKKAGVGMSSDVFDEAVGMAMRRNDVGVNDSVSKGAALWRSKVVDPLAKQAVELGLLPEDVKVTEAPSYFSRQYNVEKVVARQPEFMQITTDHYNSILQAEFVKAAETLKNRSKALSTEDEFFNMKPKARAKRLKELEAENPQFHKRVNIAEEGILERLAANAVKRKDLERKFYDTWEVRRLGEGIDVNKLDEVPDFSRHARDMAQEVYDSITGNDYGSASVDPKFHLSAKSGPLKGRTFHIPDEKIEGFLENNVVRVMSKFARQMSGQIELARKFPDDPLLTERFKQIKTEYDALTEAAKTEAERTKLQKDMKGAFRDLRALLEIHRGSYLAKENASSWGRTVRGLMTFNYLRSMGGAAIPSVSDLYNPAIFHGAGRVMEVGVKALVDGVDKIGPLIKEAKYAGVAERLAHHRLLTLTEIGDPYGQGTAIERLLDAGTHLASKWNGLNMLTDFEKHFDAIVVQDRMNEALMKGNDDKFLAYSGIGPDMRTRIKKELEAHGEELDGVTVANTELWDSFDAVRAYRSAINFNVNADIVTRGIGDVPLFAYTPMGKLVLQFKTFNLAAHQRTMLRATQLGPAQFLSGLIGLTTLGMLATVLKAWRGGSENWERFKQSAKNPGYMIGEGLDQTGFFTLPIELSNITEKATAQGGYAFNPVKTPLMLAGREFAPDSSLQGNSQRYAQKTVLETLAGPTGGLIGDVSLASGIPIDLATGKEVTTGKKHAAQRIVPYQSYLGMRELFQLLENNSPYEGQ
jgi:hypothetical protein